jgi:hypothetical protein
MLLNFAAFNRSHFHNTHRISKHAGSVQQMTVSLRMSISCTFCSYYVCLGNGFDIQLKYVIMLRRNDRTMRKKMESHRFSKFSLERWTK